MINWFVLKVRPTREIEIEKQVRALGYEAMAPYVEGRRRIHKTPRPWKFPLYTGYVFVGFADHGTAWQHVRDACNSDERKVVGRLIGGERPEVLRPADVEYLRSIADGRYRPAMLQQLMVGDRVLVPDGLLQGYPSTIVKIKRDKTAKLKVSEEKNPIFLDWPLDDLVKV
jgi:transcription antitermination factor NusG